MSAAVDEAAMDRASEADRVWFEQCPCREYRIRPYVPGELPVHELAGEGIWIIAVRNVRPGVRIRLPFHARYTLPDDEDIAEAVFRLAYEWGGE